MPKQKPKVIPIEAPQGGLEQIVVYLTDRQVQIFQGLSQDVQQAEVQLRAARTHMNAFVVNTMDLMEIPANFTDIKLQGEEKVLIFRPQQKEQAPNDRPPTEGQK